MNPDQRISTAHHIVSAIKSRQRFQPLSGDMVPETLEEAYLIQEEVYRLLQSETGIGPLAGHKIALTSKAIQDMCGVDQPVYGSIFARTIHRMPCKISHADFLRLGIECEVAFEIARPITPDDAPYDRQSIADYAGNCMPAFELIEDRAADYSELDAASLLTDRCWCGGIVLGSPVSDWKELDLENAATSFHWNGEIVDRAVTGDALGHPLAGLAWIANHLAARGRSIEPGHIIMTGSAVRTRFPTPGDEARYEIEGLGSVSVTITD